VALSGVAARGRGRDGARPVAVAVRHQPVMVTLSPV